MADEIGVGKCKVMHTRKNNPNFTYKVMISEITFAMKEWDLMNGLVINSSMKRSAQYSWAVKKKKKKSLEMENNTENIMILYDGVWSYPECSLQFPPSSPPLHQKGSKQKIERVIKDSKKFGKRNNKYGVNSNYNPVKS